MVLFAEQMKNNKHWILGFIGIISTVLSLAIFGAENLVIPAMVMIIIILAAGRNRLCS